MLKYLMVSSSPRSESIIQAVKWYVKSTVDCCRRFKDSAGQNPLQSIGHLLLSVDLWKELIFQGVWVLGYITVICFVCFFSCCVAILAAGLV